MKRNWGLLGVASGFRGRGWTRKQLKMFAMQLLGCPLLPTMKSTFRRSHIIGSLTHIFRPLAHLIRPLQILFFESWIGNFTTLWVRKGRHLVVVVKDANVALLK